MSSTENFAPSQSNLSLYEQLDQYPWDNDTEFQSGLAAILGSNSTPDQAAELTLRARCFYYARKFNTTVDFDAYKAHRQQNQLGAPNGISTSSQPPPPSPAPLQTQTQTSASTANEPPQQAPYPISFAQIVELIQTGQPIPGIKEIPPTVLQGQGTESTQNKRKKPWEKDEDAPALAATTVQQGEGA